MDDSTVPTNAISFTQDIKTSSGASGRGETHELSCDPLQNSSRTTASTPVPSTSQITSKSVEDSASLLSLGNLSSYIDIQKESPPLSATSENGQTGKNLNGMTEIVNNLHITGQRQDQLQHQNTSGSGSHSDMGGVDVTNQTGMSFNILRKNVSMAPH